MLKPLQHNGKKYDSADAYRTAKATESPRSPQQADGEAETDARPVHTIHHSDGTHTTTHEDGYAHDSTNLEELKQHLDKFLSEEQGEKNGSDDGWGEGS